MNKPYAIHASFCFILICGLGLQACGLPDIHSQDGAAVSAGTDSTTGGTASLMETWGIADGHRDVPADDTGKAVSEGKADQAVAAGRYRVYFTQPQYPDRADGRVKDVMYAVIGIIRQARSDLAIAMYMLDLDEVADAILEASQRGVRVRLVTDGETLSTSPTMQRLKAAGIPIVSDHGSALMHDKFMVVDGKGVWSGSYNWTPSGTYRNDNNAIYVESGRLAADYLQEFGEMYYNKHFGEEKKTLTPHPNVHVDGIAIEVCFSPPGRCAAKIAEAVSRAQESIRFMAFAFTSEPIAKALIERYRAGIDISGVIETYQSDKPGGDYAAFRSMNMDVLLDGNPYNMHHKVFIIDDKTVILGSFNFTRSADTVNDENVLMITGQDVAGLFLREYERVYAQAQNPPR